MSKYKMSVRARDKQGYHNVLDCAVSEDDLDLNKVTENGDLKLVLTSEPLHSIIYARGQWSMVEVTEFE